MEGTLENLKHAVLNQTERNLNMWEVKKIDDFFRELFKHECNIKIAQDYLDKREMKDLKRNETLKHY